MSDDTISGQAAIESVDMLFRPFTEYSPGMVDLAGVACNHILADVIVTLKALPSAERHGRWEFNIDDEGWSWDYPYMCDQCGEWVEKEFNFCPNCGAKME